MPWSSSDRRARLPQDWDSRRASVLRRDSFRCKIAGAGCSGIATEVDHIRRGDDHRLENLRAVCRSCHRKKSQAEALEAQRRKRELRYRPQERHPGLR